MSTFQMIPNFGQENYGLFPQFVTFHVWIAPLSIISLKGKNLTVFFKHKKVAKLRSTYFITNILGNYIWQGKDEKSAKFNFQPALNFSFLI